MILIDVHRLIFTAETQRRRDVETQRKTLLKVKKIGMKTTPSILATDSVLSMVSVLNSNILSLCLRGE